VADALFYPDGDLLVPTELTRGPWSPVSQHGGPLAAAIVRAVEATPSRAGGPMQVVRLTLDILRPVPLEPMRIAAKLTRPGRRVQIVDVSLTVDGQEFVRARALRIRIADVPVPQWPQTPFTPTATALGRVRPRRPEDGPTSFHLDGVEIRFVTGRWDDEGPATVWMRLRHPIVPDEEPNPTQRAVAAADFSNGLSRLLPFDTHTFVNPDLTVALSRPPVGEWIGMDAVTRLSDHGVGQAESLLFDGHGPVGRAVQSLFVDTLD
jgi:Thioesterase-like superfamily